MRHDRHGYWIAEAGIPEPRPPLAGVTDADVLVVGGGYTGLWAAWHLRLLQPEARIVLLEADRCGLGPSGRNGGFVNAMWHSLPSMRERFGDEAAIAVARAARDSVVAIGEFCEQEGVDAWYRRGGYMQVAVAPVHAGSWEETAAACRALGEPGVCVPLSAEEVAERCRSPRFGEGALFPGAASVQPARLAFGLRRRVAEAGAEIHERSPVRRLDATAGGVEAETPGGTIRARRCVLALGSSSAARGGPLHGRLTVTSSHMVITEPVPELLEAIGWTGGEAISDSRAMLHYFRTTPDGRIALGWGGGRVAAGARLGGRTELDRGVVEQAILTLSAYFPGVAPRLVAHAWGGPIDVSPSHLPLSLSVGPNVVAAAGFTGNGVGPAQLLGRILASVALERRDEFTRLALVDPELPRVPTGIAAWAGGNVIRAGLLRVERAEEEGRRGDLVSRALARVPELVGFHIGR